MAEAAESRFSSGFRSAGEPAEQARETAAIRAANQELAVRGANPELATSVLIEQRDRALRLVEQAHEGAQRRIEALVAEHERQLASMMSHHQQELDALGAQLDGLRRARLSRSSSSGNGSPSTRVPTLIPLDGEAGTRVAELQSENRELYDQLDAANAEIEELRAEAIRLQGERDDALRSVDDAHMQLLSEIESARDESIALQAQLDEVLRTMDDARDQAREEQCRLIEELDAVHQQLESCRQQLEAARTS